MSFGVELFVEGMVQLEDACERHRVAKLHRHLARATSTNPSAREDRDEHQSPRRPSTLFISFRDCARVVVKTLQCLLFLDVVKVMQCSLGAR